MVSNAVADVGTEGFQCRLDYRGSSRRPDDRQWHGIGCKRGDPAGDQQVAEVGDVVAVQVGEQQSR